MVEWNQSAQKRGRRRDHALWVHANVCLHPINHQHLEGMISSAPHIHREHTATLRYPTPKMLEEWGMLPEVDHAPSCLLREEEGDPQGLVRCVLTRHTPTTRTKAPLPRSLPLSEKGYRINKAGLSVPKAVSDHNGTPETATCSRRGHGARFAPERSPCVCLRKTSTG